MIYFDGCKGDIFLEREREKNNLYYFWKGDIICLQDLEIRFFKDDFG